MEKKKTINLCDIINGEENQKLDLNFNESMKYFFFYIFATLNSFLKSGFIFIKYDIISENKEIRLLVDIKGIREYEIEKNSSNNQDKASGTIKDFNNNVRNNINENFKVNQNQSNNNNFNSNNESFNKSNEDVSKSNKKTKILRKRDLNLIDNKTLNFSVNKKLIINENVDVQTIKTFNNNISRNKFILSSPNKQSTNALSINFNSNTKNFKTNNTLNNFKNRIFHPNKFNFNNLLEKNLVDSNSSIINMNSSSNNCNMNPIVNNYYENNSFLTKNIFSQSSINNEKADNLNNEINKEKDFEFFEAIKNTVNNFGGNLIFSIKENQVFSLILNFPRNKKKISNQILNNYYNNHLKSKVGPNHNYIIKCFWNNNSKNYQNNLINIFNFLINTNNGLFKSDTLNTLNNFMLNNNLFRRNSKISSENNNGINNQNNVRSFMSQEFLDEFFMKQNTLENRIFNQNIDQKNYINNYNIINTKSEPDLFFKTPLNQGKSLIQKLYKSKKRSFSIIEGESDDKLEIKLINQKEVEKLDRFDIKNKSKNKRFEVLERIQNKNNCSEISQFSNVNIKSKYGKSQTNLLSPNYKVNNIFSNREKIVTNRLYQENSISNSNIFEKNNRVNKNHYFEIREIEDKYRNMYTKKNSYTPDVKNDSFKMNMNDLKRNTSQTNDSNILKKCRIPYDSFNDSSNSDSCYTNNNSEIPSMFINENNNYSKLINNVKSNNYKKNIKYNISSREKSQISINIKNNQNNSGRMNSNKREKEINNSNVSEFNEYNNYEDYSLLDDKINNENNLKLINKRKNKLMILIVEDEYLVRQTQINLIKKYFYNDKEILIDECEDGAECLYKIFLGIKLGLKYDLIITDEKMQFIDGINLASIIKNLINKNLLYTIKIFLLKFYENGRHENSMRENNDIDLELFKEAFCKPLEYKYLKNIFGLFGY